MNTASFRDVLSDAPLHVHSQKVLEHNTSHQILSVAATSSKDETFVDVRSEIAEDAVDDWTIMSLQKTLQWLCTEVPIFRAVLVAALALSGRCSPSCRTCLKKQR